MPKIWLLYIIYHFHFRNEFGKDGEWEAYEGTLYHQIREEINITKKIENKKIAIQFIGASWGIPENASKAT